MSEPTAIQSVESFAISIPRETPYLGALESGTTANEHGYFVRPGNQSIYSIHDQSTLVKVTDAKGRVGWGECVGFIAPEVTRFLTGNVVGPLVIGRDAMDVVAIYEDLYNAMRVRGFFGGFYGDALAGLDIALWDLKGKQLGVPVAKLLGGFRRDKIPAYVSGLPLPTIPEKVGLAREFQKRGFRAFKFAAAVAGEGVVAEMRALRDGLGPEAEILCDMHWKFTPSQAIQLILELNTHRLRVAEAPVAPEDVAGLARVARSVPCSVGAGEEWRTVHEYRPRFENACMDVIQPEMGRTGLTSFWHICQMANAYSAEIMPHASIGIGIFQAASLHAAAALPKVPYHEYQHSIFDKNLACITGDMRCVEGFFHVPSGPGLGVEPNAEALAHILG